MGVKKLITVLLVMVLAAVKMIAAPEPFQRLDSLIDAQPQIVVEKQARLARLKADLTNQSSAVNRYQLLRQLYEEYAAFQYDSAYAYVTECLKLATSMGDNRLINESRLNLAHILSTACLMDKASQTLAQVDTARLSTDQLILYYRTKTDLLIYQAEYMQGTRYAEEYVDIKKAQNPDRYENVVVSAMQLPDGTIVTGRSSRRMVATAAMVLNAIKKLAGIQDDMLIISPTIFESMSSTKSGILHDKTSLNLEEVIMALTLTKLTNPFAELALKEIPNLNGCIAHCTAILSDKDERAVKALGIDITSNPEFSNNNLYSV